MKTLATSSQNPGAVASQVLTIFCTWQLLPSLQISWFCIAIYEILLSDAPSDGLSDGKAVVFFEMALLYPMFYLTFSPSLFDALSDACMSTSD